MSEFKDKVAIVTGGSSGIGQTIAEALAVRGAEVWVVASSSLKKAEAVVEGIKAKGGKAHAAAADVRDAAALEKLAAEVVSRSGRIDILVNAAGVFYPTPVDVTKPEDFDRTIDINLKGTWNGMWAAAPHMKAARSGKILNFASVAGLTALKTFGAYCASKAGIVMMTKVVAGELAPFNINVNAIAPGNTATPMNEFVRNDPSMEAMMAEMKRLTPSTTVFSDPKEIAATALFLVSSKARPVHGATWLIDEGLSATQG